ncbi:LysM peptidoglycan-binding domain-containing protein [Aeromicrobium sp. CF4.19]|uniref:LysM peptidoglycan-binding domain-containing protein n=1 Tax=Aeromicrobium sp. CF4.19 TaxID=3373082 RepID=UPI003EE69C99
MLSSTGRVVAVVATLLTAWTVPRAPDSAAALGGRDLPAALAGVLELGLLALAGWTLLTLLLASTRGAPARLGRRLVPAAVRAALFTGAVAATASAAQAGESPWPVDGLRLPERAVVAQSDPTPSTTPTVRQDEAITVQDGDTLWGLATARLSSNAGDDAVASLVRRIHQANRARIGPDPDIIHPGQRLVVPTSTSTQDDR